MKTASVIVSALLASAWAVVGAQDAGPRTLRPVPPVRSYLRPEPEASLLEQHLDEVADAMERVAAEIEERESRGEDTAELEAEYGALEQEWDALNAPPDPEFPLYHPLLLERLELLAVLVPEGPDAQPVSKETAQALVDELYTDLVHPNVNHRWQAYVLHSIENAARHPSLSRDAAQVLRDGLVDYFQAGGGVASPYREMDLCRALLTSSQAADVEVMAIATQLYTDAMSWFLELGYQEEYEDAQRTVGPFLQSALELAAAGVFPEQTRSDSGSAVTPEPEAKPVEVSDDSGQTKASLTASRPAESLREARHEFDTLVKRFNWDPSKIERVYELAFRDWGDPAVSEEFLRRLLVTYKLILTKTQGVSAEVVKVIDGHLLKMAQEGKLKTARHWQLWSDAVERLRDRASSAMKEFVKERAKVEADPMVRRAVRGAMVRAGWR